MNTKMTMSKNYFAGRRNWNANYQSLVIGALIGFSVSSFLWLSVVFKTELKFRIDASKSVTQVATRTFETKNIDNRDDGWKLIHVFYGNQSHIADSSTIPNGYFEANRWFSQYRQDEVVSKLLHGKRRGYFVDLASNDAIHISNTFALERFFGWNGLCLEPNPIYWSSLSYRKCHVAAAVIGNRDTMEEVAFNFRKGKPAKGGIIRKDFDNKDSALAEAEGNLVRRFAVNLSYVFRKFDVPKVIDYLSLDVEGAEEWIIGGFPFDEYRVNVMTIERPSNALQNLLESNGYIWLKTLKPNVETLWIHHSLKDWIDEAALDMNTQEYKYRQNVARERIIPDP